MPRVCHGTFSEERNWFVTLPSRTIIRSQGEGSLLARAVGADFKGRASMVLYAAAIPLAYVEPWLAYGIYAAVALMWLVPDRRIERVLAAAE